MKEATLDISLHLGAAADNPHEAADAKSKRQRKRVKSYLNFSANFRNGEVDFSVISPTLDRADVQRVMREGANPHPRSESLCRFSRAEVQLMLSPVVKT